MQSLGLAENGENLFLGTVSPWRSGEAIEAVVKKYLAALQGNASLYGIDRSGEQVLTYAEYLHGVGNIEKISRAYDSQDEGRRGFVFKSSQELRALTDSYDGMRYRAGPEGYAQYLLDRVGSAAALDAFTGDVPLHLPAVDRQRHSYIVGATGSGKSELLKAIVAEEARNGSAVILLDPHTDLARQVAQLPDIARSGRLVYISATAKAGESVTINPLETPAGATLAEKERMAFHLAAALDSLSGGSATSRMTRFLRECIRVLMDRRGSTLMDLYSLTGPTPPADIVALGRKHPAPMVRDFFETDLFSRDIERAKQGVRARLATMLGSSGFQAFTCGPSTISLEQAVRDSKIVVFALGSLGKVVGNDVGQLIMAMMTALGERRQVNEKLRRYPVHVIVDECQNLVGDATATILDELRKFGVHLTLAQQRAGDGMSTALKEAVTTAPAVKMVGQVDEGDQSLGMFGQAYRPMAQGLVADKGLGLFQFLCRWGRSGKPFILNVRSDLVDSRIDESQWLELVADQVAEYYRPVHHHGQMADIVRPVGEPLAELE